MSRLAKFMYMASISLAVYSSVTRHEDKPYYKDLRLQFGSSKLAESFGGDGGDLS